MSTANSTSIVPTDNPALSGTLLTYNSVVLSSFVLFVISAVVWVILSFLQKRTKKFLGCCGGRPGIVFPINFLNPRHRLVYVLACGALASTWFRALNTGDFSDVNKWAVSIVKILSVIFLLSWEIFITFPLLACVEAPVPIVGYILGAIYTDVLLALRIYVTVDVIQQQDVDGFPEDFVTLLYSKYVVSFLPQLVCIVGVLVWYHYKIIKEIVRIFRTDGTWTHAITNQPESQAQIKYVKQLLHQSNLTFFRKHIYTRVRIPFSLLIVCVVDAVIIFQLVVLVLFQIPYWFNLAGSEAEALNQNLGLGEYSFLKAIPRFFDSLTTITVIAPIVAALIVVAHFLHLLYSVQVQLKEFRTGQKKVLKSQIDWPAMTLSSSLRYAGYQIAAVITAWIVYTVVIFVLLLLVSTLILFSSELGYYYYQVFILVAWTVFLTVSQIIICKLLFVAKESRSMKTLVINNKRAFCFFSYVMLLYNIATGLMTAVLRVTLSFLSMVLLLPRMDRLLFLKGFERFDTGFGMFNSFMAVENLLQNPVAQVFVMLLQSNIRLSSENFDFAMKMFSEGGNDYTLPSTAARFSIQARNRWFVAYTLIKNPKLRKTSEGRGGYTDYSSPVLPENKPLVDEPDTDEPLLVPEKEEEFSSQYVKL